MSHRVAAVVLAAGLSSRMAPNNKLLTPMADGRPMIAHTVCNVLASAARPVIVVTGFQAPLIVAAMAGLSVQVVHAPNFANGLAASLRAGIAALPWETEAVLIMLGDMPLVEPSMLDRLLAAFDPPSGHDIAVPVWQGRHGNPRLLGRRHFEALQSLYGDAGANQLLNLYPECVAEITSPDDSVLQDFDTHEALKTLPLRKRD